MRRFTRDPAEVRRWASVRGAKPALTDWGELRLSMPGSDDAFSTRIGWEEFAGHFTAEQLAFVYDDAPGTEFHVIGREDEVRQFAEEPTPAPMV